MERETKIKIVLTNKNRCGCEMQPHYEKKDGCKMIETGMILDNSFQIISELGEGGTGLIYLAIHLRLQKYVVIKKIKNSAIGIINARKEVDMLKELHHRYLPQVYDFLEINNEVYTIIDYIEGYDLGKYIESGYEFDEETLIKWLMELSDVLNYLHTHIPPIYHCDIKPANIMITNDMDVCLIDFNISLDENDLKIEGLTPAYCSPEQMYLAKKDSSFGATIDGRSDIYSLGATFYHLMTNTKPYLGISSQLRIDMVTNKYRKSLVKVVEKMMQPYRENRYQSAGELQTAVKKSTKEYEKKFKIKIIVSVCVAAVVILAGTLLINIKKDNENKLNNKYLKKYNAIVEEFNDDSYLPEELRDKLLNDLLNNSDYTDMINNSSKEKAEISYMIGYTYFLQENYKKACEYYQKAIDLNEISKYFRELAVCNARLGYGESANKYLNKAKLLGIEKNDERQIKAEISLEEKEYTEVFRIVELIINSEANPEKKNRAAYICDLACKETGDYSKDIELLSKVRMSDKYQDNICRILTNAYFAEYKNGNNGDYELIKKSREYAENIENPTVEDVLILGNIYITTRDFYDAEKLLGSNENIKTDYRFNMWLAYAYIGDKKVDMAVQCYKKIFSMDSYKRAKKKGYDTDLDNMSKLKTILGG